MKLGDGRRHAPQAGCASHWRDRMDVKVASDEVSLRVDPQRIGLYKNQPHTRAWRGGEATRDGIGCMPCTVRMRAGGVSVRRAVKALTLLGWGLVGTHARRDFGGAAVQVPRDCPHHHL